MQFPMFQTTDELLTVILVIVAFSLWVQRFRVFKYVGPALTVILIGLTLVNLRIVPGYQDVYGVVITYCVPMSISIYLLNINLKELAKLSGKALVALVCAVFSVCLVATAFGVVFGSRMFELEIAGMFVGTILAAVPISPPLQLVLTLPMKPLLLPTQRIMSSACPPCS